MSFLSLDTRQFRNLADGEVDLNAKNVFLIGENGQGKTNLLEALYFLSFGSSFRTRIEREMVRHGEEAMALRGTFLHSDGSEGDIRIRWERGEKEIRIHDKVIRDRKELLELLPTIVFSHDDILFAGGPPERRRWFMDQTLSLYDPLYVDQLRRYRKLLKERNHLLKTRQTDLLDHYGEQLAFSGLALRERRSSLTTEFGAIFEPLFTEVSGLDVPVTIRYRPSWGEADDSQEVMTILREKQEAELGMGTTLSGPHRDRFVFISGDVDFSKSASTGQLRLLSLVLRVAQAQFYVATTGRLPILLLDDVLLELDPRRRLLFREHLPDYEQCVYTFLPGEEIGHHGENAKVYTVKDGRFFHG